MDIAIVDEEGAEIPFTSEPLAPGKMRVTLDAEPGLVFFGVTDDKGGFFEAGISVPYSDEYKRSAPNVALLTEISEATGGKVLEERSDAFRPHPYKSGERMSVVQWLILASMILFFLDITLRRFGMFKGFGVKLIPEKVEVKNSREADSLADLLKGKRKR